MMRAAQCVRLARPCVRRNVLSACLAISASLVALDGRADCFDEAAQHHHVNPWVLRAITAQESSFNPNVIHPRNTDGSVDMSWTGINSVHLPELARYGVSAADLRDACKALYVAAWHLRKQVERFGNTWEAVGAYHSKTPSKRDAYSAKIRRILDFWISQGVMPAA